MKTAELRVRNGSGLAPSTDELAIRLATDPDFAGKLRRNAAKAIASFAVPWLRDVWVYRMVVSALGLTILVAIIGSIVLAVLGKPSPEILVALGSAAVGALAGLLAPSPTKQ